MALRVPQEIQQQAVLFAFIQAEATANHLSVQSTDLCRPENNDAVHARTVPAFSQEHAVAEHLVFPVSEILQDLSAIRAVAVHLSCRKSMIAKDFTEFLTGRDQRKENHRLPGLASALHLSGDLLEVGLQCITQITGSEIPVLLFHFGQIDFERDGFGHDWTQVSAFDALINAILESA